MTNCKNCGAPLHGAICEYCGTDYSREPEFRQHEGSGCSFEQMSKAVKVFANAMLEEQHIYPEPKHLCFKGPVDCLPTVAIAGDIVLCRDSGCRDSVYVFDGVHWGKLN